MQAWAEVFDLAKLEEKKLICNQLFKRIELGKGYQVRVTFNPGYGDFCKGWKDNELTIESKEA